MEIMLNYIKKSEIQKDTLATIPQLKQDKELDNNPLLTYCNWSYAKKSHLNKEQLIDIIRNFDRTKLPYYIRIFNEAPVGTIKYFMDSNGLSYNDLRKIWKKLSAIRGIMLRDDFWQSYNNRNHTLAV